MFVYADWGYVRPFDGSLKPSTAAILSQDFFMRARFSSKRPGRVELVGRAAPPVTERGASSGRIGDF